MAFDPLSAGLGVGMAAWDWYNKNQANKQNVDFERNTNTDNRNFQEYMHNKSHDFAMQDWERQNKYNSPQQQMQRLKEAGLNPNLIYGNGATATAGPIHTPSADGTNAKAPQVIPLPTPDLQGMLAQSTNITGSQIDQEMKAAQIDLIHSNIIGKDLGNQKNRKVMDAVVQGVALRNEKLKQDMSLGNWKQANLMTDLELKSYGLDHIQPLLKKKLQAEINLLMSSQELKHLDVQLRLPSAIMGALGKLGLGALIPGVSKKISGKLKGLGGTAKPSGGNYQSTSDWMRSLKKSR